MSNKNSVNGDHKINHRGREPRNVNGTTSKRKIADQIHRQVKARFGRDVETIVIDGKEFHY